MHGPRKQAISLRVAAPDLRRVKKLAERLGVSDSDVIRFAVKTMLGRVAPLCDDSVHGRALLPVFLEAGNDLFRHFDLDTTRLREIINHGAEKGQEVEFEDLQLIARAGIQQSSKLRLDSLPPGVSTDRRSSLGADASNVELRGYLYSKYADAAPPSDVGSE